MRGLLDPKCFRRGCFDPLSGGVVSGPARLALGARARRFLTVRVFGLHARFPRRATSRPKDGRWWSALGALARTRARRRVLYLTVRRSRTKGMYEPATRALRSVFTLSWCREASCFSVRKTSSRTSAAEERLGVERFNLSVISKNLPRPGIDGILNRAGFSILELRPVAGARTMVAGKRGASLNSVGLFNSRATTTWEGAHDVAGKRGASLNSGDFLAVGIGGAREPRAWRGRQTIGRLKNVRRSLTAMERAPSFSRGWRGRRIIVALFTSARRTRCGSANAETVTDETRMDEESFCARMTRGPARVGGWLRSIVDEAPEARSRRRVRP